MTTPQNSKPPLLKRKCCRTLSSKRSVRMWSSLCLECERFQCSHVIWTCVICAGSFANTLPVYQRSEVMLFIMGKIPVPGIYPALGSPNAGYRSQSDSCLFQSGMFYMFVVSVSISVLKVAEWSRWCCWSLSSRWIHWRFVSTLCWIVFVELVFLHMCLCFMNYNTDGVNHNETPDGWSDLRMEILYLLVSRNF